jgi:hypothetical protein
MNLLPFGAGIDLNRANAEVFNNVVIVNDGRGIEASDYGHTIKNNSVVGGEKGIYRYDIGEMPVVQYNNCWNNDINFSNFTPDSTNISFDPMYVNPDSMDFRLQMYSPLIDAGDPNILDADGSRSDIGVHGGPFGTSYEYLDLPPRIPVNLEAAVDSDYVILTWNENTEADFKYYRVYKDTASNFQIDPSNLITETGKTEYREPKNNRSTYYKITATDGTGNESDPSEEAAVLIVGVEEPKIEMRDYILYQNYPNPFNAETTIGYRIKNEGYVKVTVYDIKGERIAELVNAYQRPGYYEIKFKGTERGNDIASGIYLYKIEVMERGIPVYVDMKKMIELK